MEKRVRRVSKEQLSKMSDEQLAQIEEKLGSKIRELVDEAAEQINDMLSIYGLQVKMQILIEEKE